MQTHKTQQGNKPHFRANGSILPLALRPGLLVGDVMRPIIVTLILAFLGIVNLNSFSSQNASASSVTLTVPSSSLSLDIKPNSGTVFQKSSAGTVSIKTDSSYGYSLSIHSKNGDSDSGKSNDLLNGSNKISSITSPLNESDFQTSGEANTWGYLPSKLNSSANDNFQPGPTSEPTIIDITESSSESTDYDITLATKIDNSLPAGTYHNTFVLTAVSNEPPLDNLMQGYDGLGWKDCDALEAKETVRLIDTRDGKNYTVSKLKNDLCWMTQNLAIGSNDSAVELTSENTDLPTGVYSYTLHQGNTNGFLSSSQEEDIYIGAENFEDGSQLHAGYYSWDAATAGTGKSISNDDAEGSICPKGWRLPTSSELSSLSSSYNNNASGDLLREPFNFVRSGRYANSKFLEGGSTGYYWSSTIDSRNTAYYQFVSSTYSSSGWNRADGLSIRCVARSDNPKKVGTMQTVGEWEDTIEKGKVGMSEDIRDGKEYTVARLKDGRLWMTQNLAIGDNFFRNRTLTSADSDVEEDFILPQNTTKGFDAYDQPFVYVDSNVKYGGYYSWYVATAGEGTLNKTHGDTSHSICPKGWKLPSMYDIVILDKALGGSGQSRGEIEEWRYQSSPNYFVRGGYYASSSGAAVGDYAYYWSATAYPGNSGYAFNLYFQPKYVNPQNTSSKSYGYPVRCVARNSIGTLQNVLEWKDQVEDGETVSAIDVRDGNEYTVAKLADEKLWMTQNLRIADIDLTPEDSDIDSNFNLPSSISKGFNNYYNPTVHMDVDGGYYNWVAATAGEGTQDISAEGQDVEHSICPKGWRLPTYSEITSLVSAYNRSYELISVSPANFTLSGYFYDKSLYRKGSSGEYWSSTAYNSSVAYRLYLDSSIAGVGGSDGYKSRGYSIRCVIR